MSVFSRGKDYLLGAPRHALAAYRREKNNGGTETVQYLHKPGETVSSRFVSLKVLVYPLGSTSQARINRKPHEHGSDPSWVKGRNSRIHWVHNQTLGQGQFPRRRGSTRFNSSGEGERALSRVSCARKIPTGELSTRLFSLRPTRISCPSQERALDKKVSIRIFSFSD